MSDRTCLFKDCDAPHHARGYCARHCEYQRRHGLLPAPVPIEERFWANVDDSGGPDECWPWTAALDRKGYGRFYRGKGFSRAAHRAAYEFATGHAPDGLQVDHLCWNPACCNPRHLRAVTHSENQQNRRGAARNNKSGYRGVATHRKNRWVASASHNGVTRWGGSYETPEAAAEAARLLRLEVFTCNEADR